MANFNASKYSNASDPSSALRQAIISNAAWFVKNRKNVFYLEKEDPFINLRMSKEYLNTPRRLLNLGEANSIFTDCSGSVLMCYYWAGIANYLAKPTRRSRINVRGQSFVPIDQLRNWINTGGFYTGIVKSSFPTVPFNKAKPGDILYRDGHIALITGVNSSANKSKKFTYFNHGGKEERSRCLYRNDIDSFQDIRRWPGVL